MSYKDDLSYKIATYSGPRLVALQYQAIIENLQHIKDIATSQNADKDRLNFLLDKNRDIFSNLMVSLEEPTQFNIKTKSLYLYAVNQTDIALIQGDMSLIDNIIRLLDSTMKSWETVADRQGSEDGNMSVGATYGKKDINIYGSKNQWEG